MWGIHSPHKAQVIKIWDALALIMDTIFEPGLSCYLMNVWRKMSAIIYGYFKNYIYITFKHGNICVQKQTSKTWINNEYPSLFCGVRLLLHALDTDLLKTTFFKHLWVRGIVIDKQYSKSTCERTLINFFHVMMKLLYVALCYLIFIWKCVSVYSVFWPQALICRGKHDVSSIVTPRTIT